MTERAEAIHFERQPRFRRLRDYLATKAPPGKLPGRRQVDPLDIPDLLPYVMLVDVLRSPGQSPRYRVRLVGTEVVKIQGADGTGKFVEQILTEGPDIIAGYAEILSTKRPQYRRGEVATVGRDHVFYERIAFPLASDGDTVDMLMFIFSTDPATTR